MKGWIGPFEVIAGAAVVPGARFLKAVGPGAELVVLQVSYLHPAHAGRESELRRMARVTDKVRQAGLPVGAHGAADLEDGRCAVFWSLPWPLPQPMRPPPDDAAWAALTGRLLARLAALHAVGLRAPLLTEGTVFEGSGGPDWFGVPVTPLPSWTGCGTPPSRTSPTERADPTEKGDLWRLSQVLRAFRPFEDQASAQWLEELAAERYASCTEAAAAASSAEAMVPLTSNTARKTMSTLEQAAVADVAMSWSQPVLQVPDSSPWSEVESAVWAEPEPTSGVRTAPFRIAALRRAGPARSHPSHGLVLVVIVVLVVFGAIAFVARSDAVRGCAARSFMRGATGG